MGRAPGLGDCGVSDETDFFGPIIPGDPACARGEGISHSTAGANYAHTLPVAGLRVLLAEDNLVNQKVASRMLEKQNYSVTIAGNGVEAIEALEGQTFDLVLMDIQMPEMDGLQAAKAIRENERANGGGHIPIIALTAHAMTGDRERFLEAGMDGYVTKPIRMAELLGEIGRLRRGVSEEQGVGFVLP